MTFITCKLQERIDEAEKNMKEQGTAPGASSRVAYLQGLIDAKHVIVRAEAELQKRIWDAWVAEGVEPK